MLPRFLIATLALTLASSAGLAASPRPEAISELSFPGIAATEADKNADLWTEAGSELRFDLPDLDSSRRLAAFSHAPQALAQVELAWPKSLEMQDEASSSPLAEAVALELPPISTAYLSTKNITAEPAFFILGETNDARLWRANTVSYSALKREARHLKESPPRSLRGASDLGCLAVAIYHEARDQSTHGKLAVASVIQSRARVPGRWGDDACEVVKPVQFSFMTSEYGFPSIDETDPWHDAVDLALKSLIDGPLPELGGADHYHAAYVDPDWRHKMVRIGRIGAHIFYRDPSSPRI